MHTKLAVLLTVFVFAVPCYAAFEDSSVDDTQAVEQVSAQFYKSLNVMFTGDAAPMLQVWSQADDVTYMQWLFDAGLRGGVNYDALGAHGNTQAPCAACDEVYQEVRHEGPKARPSLPLIR